MRRPLPAIAIIMHDAAKHVALGVAGLRKVGKVARLRQSGALV